jgi:flagellar biosynthesis protein
VALGYERGKDRAPRVLAKGSGIVAERILELAKAHGVPVREDPALVSLLATVDVDSEIPPALYHAVAEVLAFVYRLREARS